MRKINEENERIKRRYLQYLKAAKRKNSSTVQKAAEGILRFEASTNYARECLIYRFGCADFGAIRN